MFEISMALGILGGLLSYELIGFSPGGFVTPWYLVLFIDQPTRLLGTFMVSGLTFIFVKILSNFMILYGHRRFVITLLISFLLGWIWDISILQIPYSIQELRVIGFIIPGLIANDMERQGIPGTIAAFFLVITFVRLSILIVNKLIIGL